MLKKLCLLFFLSTAICAAPNLTLAQTPEQLSPLDAVEVLKADAHAVPKSNADLNHEVEALRHRVEELESQNRALAELLNVVKTKLDSLPDLAHSEEHQITHTPSVTATLPRASASTESTVSNIAPVVRAEPAVAKPTVPANLAGAGEPLHWSDLVGAGNQFKFYGFLRLDMDIDSQRANNDQTPLFITSADPRLGKSNAGDFSMHPRLTRFGIDYSGPRVTALGDSKLSGKLELDFENGGSESRQIIRIRHAYLKMDTDHQLSILAGQTWDVVSPLFPAVNNDTLMWNVGNVGDRRPQFRLSWEPKQGQGQWSFAGAAGLTGAIDAQDLDNNGYRDGEEAGRPNLQARIGYSYSSWVKDQRVSFGASGFYGWLNTARAIAGRTDFRTQLVNLDYTLPLSSRVSLRGEGWWGHNLSDVRGGIGQGINLVTGREIQARGGWSEISLKLSRYWSLLPGYSTDDPVDDDIPNGGRARNRVFYVGNRLAPGANLLLGIDYLRWRTDYRGFLPGTNNRVNIFLQYTF